MTGFKNFILRGNLVELAVAFIIGVAFAAVVTAFTAWLTCAAARVRRTTCSAPSRAVRRLHERR